MFENLTINRVIVHEIYKRGPDKQLVQPMLGTALVELDVLATTGLQERIVAVLGTDSHSVRMDIEDQTPVSAWNLSKQMLDSDDAGFVIASQNLAIKLAHAQTHGGLPGGILVIIEGTTGATNKRVLLIIKAEPHNGFTHDGTGITYLQGIFLTPATRFYKVGAFVEEVAAAALPAAPAGETHPPTAGWASVLYDEHITKGNRMHAAQYFYSGFLGLQFPANNAFQTKVFFELTKKFLLEQDLPSDKKSDLLDGLYTYLKVDTSPHVHVSSFATQYVSGQQINETPALQDSYRNYMAENAFPTHAIPKDLSELEKALRQREWRFSNNMRFVGPADMFKDMVTMSVIAGQADDQGVVPEWTQIVVKDKIRSQE